MSSSQISSSSSDAVDKCYNGLLDVACDVEVIVGRGVITVRDCLKLRRNVVIRLQQEAGADLQVCVQGVPTASGEIVIDYDSTSVRVSRILPPPSVEARS
jgi:flagellar motor switch/type III secretory pathway protein FliN